MRWPRSDRQRLDGCADASRAAHPVYYDSDPDPVPVVPREPRGQDVAEARRLICDELPADFPFANPGNLAAAVAPLILPCFRDRIDGATPMHLFDGAHEAASSGQK